MNVPNYVTSLIRTVVPALWGTAIAWLVSAQLIPQNFADTITGDVTVFLVTAAIGGYYALARWLETRTWVPPWLSAILLGTKTVPAYLTQYAAGMTKAPAPVPASASAFGSTRSGARPADRPARPTTSTSAAGSPADERPTQPRRSDAPTTGGEPVTEATPRHRLDE